MRGLYSILRLGFCGYIYGMGRSFIFIFSPCQVLEWHGGRIRDNWACWAGYH